MSQSKGKKIAVKRTNDVAAGSLRDSVVTEEFLFGRKNFIIMLIGLGLIGVGMLLMSGGGMPSPEVWDEDIIYSTRRTLLAPIVILIGLGMQIYAIFAKK